MGKKIYKIIDGILLIGFFAGIVGFSAFFLNGGLRLIIEVFS